jgi:predicted nucleic-acid-binding Zn-ribbon protein
MTNIFSNTKRKEILDSLDNKGANQPCARCGNDEHDLLDGYFNHGVQADVKNTQIGGKRIPSIATVCTKCGNINFHAAGIILPAHLI